MSNDIAIGSRLTRLSRDDDDDPGQELSLNVINEPTAKALRRISQPTNPQRGRRNTSTGSRLLFEPEAGRGDEVTTSGTVIYLIKPTSRLRETNQTSTIGSIHSRDQY